MRLSATIVFTLLSVSFSETFANSPSFGTLLSCGTSSSTDCQWMGLNDQHVSGRVLQQQMLQQHPPTASQRDIVERNLAQHIQYLEDVIRYADQVGHTFSYRMGVNPRHLMEDRPRSLLPQMVVHQDRKASTRRHLQSTSGSTTSSYFNWCDSNNPQKRSVCTSIKSQANCGSCWAFAATDAIETAVAIAANQTQAVALSPQQFLSCSTRDSEETFQYCWASRGVSGMPWVSSEIRWVSKNSGCNGGMTHGAFQDAAQLKFGLLPELVLPYTDDDGSTSGDSCIRTSNQSVASISGWSQVVGKDCSVTSNATQLLQTALQKQPIAVAINSQDPFKDYKGGFYSCPNNGVLNTKDDVNHALLLVGYGYDASVGNYWILKNSYGSSWGDKGYIKLVADDLVNCGLNLFPVIPTGASATANVVSVDGGGSLEFLGLSPKTWIVIGIIVSIVVVVATIIGLFVQRIRRKALRNQVSGPASAYHLHEFQLN